MQELWKLNRDEIRVADIFVPDELIAKEDQGYPDARMVERKNFEYLVQDNSSVTQDETVYYTIQFIALRNTKNVTYFSDLNQVNRYKGDDGLYRFETGRYENNDKTMDELIKVRKMVYKDAFVVPTSHF